MPEITDRRISFNAGEISPWLDPRIDLDKYRSSCIDLQNMLPLPYGGAFRRMGTVPLGYTKSNNRALLRPFTAGSGTTWMLEFTALKLRIWTTGTTPALVQSGGSDLEITTPYTLDDLRQLQFVQLNDLLFIAHGSHAPRVLSRFSATDWNLKYFITEYPATLEVNATDVEITTPISAPAAAAAYNSATTYSPGDRCTDNANGVDYTWVATDTTVGHEPSKYSKFTGSYFENSKSSGYWDWRNLGPTADVATTPTYAAGKRITLTASSALFSSDQVGQRWLLAYDQPAMQYTMDIPATSVNATTAEVYVLGTWSASLAATTTGTADWAVRVDVLRSYDGIAWETIASLEGNDAEIQHLLTGSEDLPCFLQLKLISKSGTLPTNYAGRINTTAPKWIGIVRLTEYLTTTTFRALIEFPLPSAGGGTFKWSQDAWGGDNGWPSAVCIHEGRLFFGGTSSRPTTVWGSRIDRFEDFRLAAEEDAAVSYTLASGNTSRIRWMISNDDLILGTQTDEWIIARRNVSEGPRARRQSTYGTTHQPPILAGDSVLYLQSNRRKLREFAWNFDRSRYASNDLNLLSEHLGDSLFCEFAVAQNPHTIAWIINAAGDALTCLYDREQNITGWAQHTTVGDFESVAIVPGANGKDDEVWFCIKRSIDGSDLRVIERINPYGMSYLKDATDMDDFLVYVDHAIQGDLLLGDITGVALATLEGEDVDVIFEGKWLGQFTITAGEITGITDTALAGVCTIGLRYTSAIQPTYLEFDDPKQASKAGKKRLHRAVIELYKSRGGQITGNGYRSYVDIEDNLADDNSLFTGLIETYVQADTERQATPRLRIYKPFPFNVLSITSRYNYENA